MKAEVGKKNIGKYVTAYLKLEANYFKTLVVYWEAVIFKGNNKVFQSFSSVAPGKWHLEVGRHLADYPT